jgi:broad specificity phosphatase PhoE
MIHKRIVFIRHAHRDTEIHSRDNGLSEKGKKQVRQVVRFSRSRELENALFLTSPKIRCVETITPVAEERPPSPEPPSPCTLFRQTSAHLLNLRDVMNSQKRASAAERYTARLHAWPVV